MSFAVSPRRRARWNIRAAACGGLFAQPGNLASPRFWSMLRDLVRFYRQAPRDARRIGPHAARRLSRPAAATARPSATTISTRWRRPSGRRRRPQLGTIPPHSLRALLRQPRPAAARPAPCTGAPSGGWQPELCRAAGRRHRRPGIAPGAARDHVRAAGHGRRDRRRIAARPSRFDHVVIATPCRPGAAPARRRQRRRARLLRRLPLQPQPRRAAPRPGADAAAPRGLVELELLGRRPASDAAAVSVHLLDEPAAGPRRRARRCSSR